MNSLTDASGAAGAGGPATEPAPAEPKRARRQRKSTHSALVAADANGYARGFEDGREFDRQPMLGTLAALVIWTGIAFGLGAWLF